MENTDDDQYLYIQKLRKRRSALWCNGDYLGGCVAAAVAHPGILISAVALVGGTSALSITLQKYLFENMYKEHPVVHKDSPRLGAMVKELYIKAGLKETKFPVYDFRLDEGNPNDKKEKKTTRQKIAGSLSELVSLMASVPNAAAVIVRTGTLLGIMTVLNPLYLGYFAAAHGISALNSVFSGTFSRSMEYQADRGAVQLGGDPLALITALRKMTIIMERAQQAAYSTGKVPKSGYLTSAWKQIKSTHPTLNQRVGRLSAIARKQGVSEAEITKAVSGTINVPAEHNIPVEIISKMLAR